MDGMGRRMDGMEGNDVWNGWANMSANRLQNASVTA